MKKIYFLFLLALFSVKISAQKHRLMFEHISMVDGLSQMLVNDIIQDSTGFMWFATQDGLNCYDGYSFRVFKPSLANPHSISSNNVNCLFQDSKGIIWVGTNSGGLNIFDPKTEQFQLMSSKKPTAKTMGMEDVYEIVEDAETNIWIATFGGGIYRYNRAQGTFTNFRHNKNDLWSIPGNAARTIAVDKYGDIWVGLSLDARGLCKYEKKTKKFKRVDYKEHDIMSIKSDSKGNLWIGSYFGGFSVLNPKNHQYIEFLPTNKAGLGMSSDIIWTFFEDTKAKLMYIGTRGGGLNIFSTETLQWVSSHQSSKEEYSLAADNVLSIYKDNTGIVWVGTETNGLFKINTNRKKFTSLHPNKLGVNVGNSDNVTTIYVDENGTWIGVRGAALQFLPKNSSVSRIINLKGSTNEVPTVLSIVKDASGEYWFGTEGQGLFKYNFKNNTYKYYEYSSEDPNTIPNNSVQCLFIDKDSALWIGTFGGGLARFDYKKNQFKRFVICLDNFVLNTIWCIMQDSYGDIWAGTNGKGLIKLNLKKNSVIFYERDKLKTTSISNNTVYSLLETKKGDFYVGTGGGGLCKMNRKTGEFETFSKNEGLLNDFICYISEDNTGDIWVSTLFGLSKFNTSTLKFSNFTKRDGLQDNLFSGKAGFKSADGLLYFGGSQGYTYFNPDSIRQDSYAGRLVITDLKIFNNSVRVGEKFNGEVILDKAIAYLSEIELSYKYNFSIEFANLNYIAPEKQIYKYRLVGFDDEWRYTDNTKRFATYTNLSGGTYEFEVMATNNDGEWGQEVTRLTIVIVPPFWKTSWFYSILFIIVALAIYSFIKIRERNLREDKRKLEQMVNERTQEINNQKEELQQQSDLLLKNNKELSRTNRLINDSISYAKKIQDAMLPSGEEMIDAFPESFVLFKPRDIVSGDFYWTAIQGSQKYLAVADCTGHGVPGAFMSMIGSTLLNEISFEHKNEKPAKLLEKLHKGVVKALRQQLSPDSQDDGMDITLIAVDTEKRSIQIASAKQSLYYVYGNTIEVIEGDYQSIGGFFEQEDSFTGYTNHEFTYKPGSRFYLFSDGFQDQFGGKLNKKFQVSRFKETLFESSKMSMSEQLEFVNSAFEEWKGVGRQIDDVLVIGIELE